MVKTLIKLLIVAALLNACARAAMVAWTYYQFEDAVQEMALFGAKLDASDLQNRVVAKAGELNVPLAPEAVDVQRDGVRTVISAHYTQPVELFPGYVYQANLAFEAGALAGAPLTPTGAPGQP